MNNLFLQTKYHWGRFEANAHAVDAHVDEFEEMFLRADGSRALYLDAPLRCLHHGFNHFGGGTVVLSAGEEAR